MFGSIGLQIEYLLLLQNLRELTHGFFDPVFSFITCFGEFLIPVGFVAIMYWGFSKKIGEFLLLSFSFGMFFNVMLKTMACIYRPWLLDARVKPLASAVPMAEGYSFPSGHTAIAMGVWGGLAFLWKNKIARFLLILLIFSVAFSRNYLGVHTSQDVVVSMIVGIGILYMVDFIIKWVDENPEKREIIFFALATFAVILMAIFILTKNYPVDFINGEVLADPADMRKSGLGKLSFIWGGFLGLFLERKFVKFQPETKFSFKKAAFLVLGLAILGLFLVYLAKPLAIIFGKLTGTMINGFLGALFVTFLYPLFLKAVNK